MNDYDLNTKSTRGLNKNLKTIEAKMSKVVTQTGLLLHETIFPISVPKMCINLKTLSELGSSILKLVKNTYMLMCI